MLRFIAHLAVKLSTIGKIFFHKLNLSFRQQSLFAFIGGDQYSWCIAFPELALLNTVSLIRFEYPR